MKKNIKLGIRQLVEFCCRTGDLGFDGAPSASAQEGLRTHQKIQRRYDSEAIAEHRVLYEVDIDEYHIELGGRIDLLFEQESPPRVEEIKTIYSFMNAFADSYEEPHWAQVKCYAACYLQQVALDEVVISLNYVNLFNHQEYRQTKVSKTEELAVFLQQLLKQYLHWFRLIENQRAETVESSQQLEFPHQQFRQQQRYFAAQVYRNIQSQQQLMVEAPTGSGKTISTLFPSVKAIGEGLADQIIFLSAKTSGQNQAVAAIENMIKQGLSISYLVIQAKAKCCVCNHDSSEIDDDGKCIRSLGFFDRLADAREELVKSRHLSSESIRAVADRHCLCPFELSLQMLPWVDIVIADFNYVFDPSVQLSYFNTDSKRKVLLIDELHNLVDRARGMYSASISRKQIKSALTGNNSAEINRAVSGLQRALDKQFKEQQTDELVSAESSLSFNRATSRFTENLGLNLFSNKRVSSETLELCKAAYRYQCINNLYGGHHKTIGIKPLAQRQIKLLCLNAFEYLRDVYPLFSSVCGFSATLTPDRYFLTALGFEENVRSLRIDSCFPQDRLKVSICSYVDTRYRQRDQYIDQICATIYRCSQARLGNYLVFFSSYFFMQSVYQRFHQLYASIETMLQVRDSDDEARQQFLHQFCNHEKMLGFAIMGGIFAEGIDYRGESLVGAIVVGVGMPQASTEQRLIQSDFEYSNLNGFDYAFLYPGLIRVQQSAGRVIRSEKDRGVVILLDQRFRHSAYRALYPPYWQTEHCSSIELLAQSLDDFWQQQAD